ncbi:hypothetical protein G9A89_000167 [Geosiphon pyriformis]|nr:hypothetical protein G9A89_000167 [Geosiphon pyriformis]
MLVKARENYKHQHHFNYQQPVQQQLLQQPPQPPNLDPMTYAPIVKLDNFTGKEDDAQVWLNDIEKAITANRWNNAQAIQAISYFLKDTTDSWYQSLVNKPQDFNAFKVEFLRYFSNNNSINRLVNTFTTMKQGKTEVVTTYLGHFHRNLCQIQAIDANYFTVSQILNQFICGLHSSILQHWQQETRICHYCGKQEYIQIDCHQRLNNQQSENQYQNPDCQFQTPNQYPNQNQPAYLPVTQSLVYQSLPQQIQTPPQSLPPNGIQRLRMTQQSWRSAMVIHQLILSSLQQSSGLHQWNSGAGQLQNPNSQNYLSLLVTLKDVSTNNSAFAQKQPLTSNILSATITEDESLATIFPFEFEETTAMPLFSGAPLEAKPITAMYTDAKVEEQSIKLILDSGSVGSIIT